MSLGRVASFASLLLASACDKAQSGTAVTHEPSVTPGFEQPTRRWVDLEVESNHGCAIDRSGELWCWGKDPAAALDQRPLTREIESQFIWSWAGRFGPPSRVQLDQPARDVSLYEDRICAVLDDGRVRCWSEQRGIFDLVGAPPLTKLDSTHDEICGLDEHRSLWCWSSDLVVDRRVDRVVSFDLGNYYRCAIDEDENLLCWGVSAALCEGSDTWLSRHYEYKRGSPPFTEVRQMRHVPTAVGLWSAAGAIYLRVRGGLTRIEIGHRRLGEATPMKLPHGDFHPGWVSGAYSTCMVSEAGEVACWGQFDHAVPGLGYPFMAASPVTPDPEIVDLPPTHLLALSSDFSCAAGHDDEIRCWGWDVGASTLESPPLVPEVWLPFEASWIATDGNDFTCARVESEPNELRCWGNRWIDMSDPDGSLTRPLEIVLSEGDVPPSLEPGWRLFEGGLMLDVDGRLSSAWLSNPAAKPEAPWTMQVLRQHTGVLDVASVGGWTCWLYRGGKQIRCDPRYPEIVDLQLNVEPKVAITLADESICALDSGGRVACEPLAMLSKRNHRPFEFMDPDLPVDVLGLVATRQRTCAITTDEVSCWEDEYGTPRDRARVQRHGFLPKPQLLAASDTQFCVVQGKGKLDCIATDDDSRWHFLPVPEIQGDIAQLAVGNEHACARMQGGQVVCWGDFRRGQLGARHPQLLRTPTKLPLP